MSKKCPPSSTHLSETNTPAVDARAPETTVPVWRMIAREPVALGLVPLILMRPWLDGVTYPTDNFYFVWGIIALFALWAVRTLMRGEPIRGGLPMLLLGGFLCIAAITSVNTIQFNNTYRTFIYWAGHFLLFVVACNALRTRTAIAIVLTTVVATTLAESVWSLLHFRYILPQLRDMVKADPNLLRTYFQVEQGTAEILHRLLVNRAFGSFLFPNALAAFLIVTLPYVLGVGVQSVQALLRSGRDGAATAPAHAAFVGACTWVLTACVTYLAMMFAGTMEFTHWDGWEYSGPMVHDPQGKSHWAGFWLTAAWVLFVVVMPLVLGVIAARGWRRGPERFALLARVTFLPPLAVVQLIALWLTYSRGGILALLLAACVAAALLGLPKWQGLRRPLRAVPTAVVAWLACAVVLGLLAPAAAEPPGTPAPEAINRQGIDLTMKDLANPASFSLRVGYWQSGLDMAKANLLTGVGLGNFKAAYPQYRRLLAGPVQAAHNDYLQAACETGLFGFLAFCGFWAYFLWWGARRVLAESHWPERVALASLYTGVLAFLLHSLVDFNFFNPSLAFFAILLAGVFYARADADRAPSHTTMPTIMRQAILVLLLIAAAVVGGMTLRVFVVDYRIGGRSLANVGNQTTIEQVQDAAQFFLQKAPNAKPTSEGGLLPTISLVNAAKIINNRAALESFGSIHVPDSSAQYGHRKLRPGEAIDQNAFLIVTKPALARDKAIEYADTWLASLQESDSLFPYTPETAVYFARFYDLLTLAAPEKEQKLRYADQLVRWAKAAVDRSPREPATQQLLGQAYMVRGNLEMTAAQWDYFAKAMAAYRAAAESFPSSPDLWKDYGQGMVDYGKALEKGGDPARGKTATEEGQAALRRSEEMAAARRKAGLGA